jgi:hypothetical protein
VPLGAALARTSRYSRAVNLRQLRLCNRVVPPLSEEPAGIPPGRVRVLFVAKIGASSQDRVVAVTHFARPTLRFLPELSAR